VTLRPKAPTRNAGFVACLIGVLVMLSGRYIHGVPQVLVYVGVSIIVFGWGLLALSMFRVKS
jgi:hypothetical protein